MMRGGKVVILTLSGILVHGMLRWNGSLRMSLKREIVEKWLRSSRKENSYAKQELNGC